MVRRFILALLVAIATAAAAVADELTISGEVTYRERIALPPEPMLHLRLVDVDNPDAPAVVEAEGKIASPGKVPLAFTLRFEAGLIETSRSYAITAEITSDGKLWFATLSPHPLDPTAGTVAEPIVLGFAGRFGHTGDDQPTADPAPAADDPGSAALLDVVWRVTALGNQAVDPAMDASLSIAADRRAGGRGGCNSYFAQVWLQGEHLQFSAIAATEMACSNPVMMGLETRYFAALQATRFWRVAGEEMVLLDGGGRELVSFAPSMR